MKKRILFVTGTDTGVGKTFVSAGLVQALRNCGLNCNVCKPIESGVDAGVQTDAQILWTAQGKTQPREDVCLYSLKAPLAPAVAANIEKISVDFEKVVSHIARLSNNCDVLLVEGAGGLLVPLFESLTLANLCEKVAGEFVLVVGSRLGAINHTALTLEVLRARNLPTLGYVLNEPFDLSYEQAAASTNREAIAKVAKNYKVSELGYVRHGKTAAESEISSAFSAIVLRFLS